MSDQPRPPPQSTVQVAGQAASDVIGGLKQQPALLGLVVLNCIGIGAAVWFLHELRQAQQARMDVILERCLPPAKGSGTVEWPPITWPPETSGSAF